MVFPLVCGGWMDLHIFICIFMRAWLEFSSLHIKYPFEWCMYDKKKCYTLGWSNKIKFAIY